jgi:hypothetical protein
MKQAVMYETKRCIPPLMLFVADIEIGMMYERINQNRRFVVIYS